MFHSGLVAINLSGKDRVSRHESLAAGNSAGMPVFVSKPAGRWGNEAFLANNLYN